jgi:hypothetical protein
MPTIPVLPVLRQPVENKRFQTVPSTAGCKLWYWAATCWHERLLKLERQTEATAPALLRMLNGYQPKRPLK